MLGRMNLELNQIVECPVFLIFIVSSLDNLLRVLIDSVSARICNGVRLRSVSRAAVGAECHAPVMALQAKRWNLLSLSRLLLWVRV